MDNPFKKRKSELITDRRTLLSLISAQPITAFFRDDGANLIDKLALVVGTPGCGKTTIARAMEFDSLSILCGSDADQINRDLVLAMTKLKFLEDGHPTIIGHWMAMTNNFRDIKELPYSEPIKAALLRAYVQSRSVLGWFRQLDAAKIAMGDVEIVMGDGADSMIATTHADNPADFREYARTIELAIHKIVTALVPPDENEMVEEFLNTRYDIFEVFKGIRVRRWSSPSGSAAVLRPLLIIDDAHELHPSQFIELRDWLKSKAMGVSRWLVCRPDAVAPEDYRDAMTYEDMVEEGNAPGSTRGRDYIIKLMQLGSRQANRFKPVARDVANIYVRSIPELAGRQITSLQSVLDRGSAELADGIVKQLKEQTDKIVRDARFAPALVDTLKARVPEGAAPDEALAVLRILLHREKNRTPQMGLLPDDTERETPLTTDRKAAPSLLDGARIQLMHQFGRPYYYGMDKLIAASNVNLEQFISLSGALVDELLARIMRNRTPEISPKQQHEALVGQAKQAIGTWDFPYHAAVRDLVNAIAERCKEKTLLGNAPLDDGANAIGIPQDEMDKVLARSERLTRILHFAFAYKALVFVPQYSCKNRMWCLLELGALPCMAHGLTLRRGGFIEDTLAGVQSMVGE